jgi:hypothetical protein
LDGPGLGFDGRRRAQKKPGHKCLGPVIDSTSVAPAAHASYNPHAVSRSIPDTAPALLRDLNPEQRAAVTLPAGTP